MTYPEWIDREAELEQREIDAEQRARFTPPDEFEMAQCSCGAECNVEAMTQTKDGFMCPACADAAGQFVEDDE